MGDNKNYYAIIPANVRYDKSITANAKLLYGEITALCNEKGYCWASNNYFAELYEVQPQAISKWVKQLELAGYVTIEYIRKGKEISQRQVSINIDRYQQKDNTVSTKAYEGINKNVIPYQQKRKDNNTYNNKSNNTYNRFTKPTIEQIAEYCKERNNNIDAEYFYNYYESKGWMIGKNKMKSWKAAVVTWEKRDIDNKTTPIQTEKDRKKEEALRHAFGDEHYEQLKKEGKV